LSEEEYSTLNYIAHCRHGELGYNAARCNQCHNLEWYPSSCGNRHCPNCLGPRQAQWSEKVCERLPDCPHFHTVFTVPDQARAFFALNYETAVNLLFAAASDTLKQFQTNNWGVEGGFFGVYHSWGSRMNQHPHLHMLVSSGGRDIKTSEWKQARPTYLFPVKLMSRVYGAIFIRKLEELDAEAAIEWPDGLKSLEERRDWRLSLARCQWVIFNRPTLNNTRAVVRYLARYTSRIAISNQRIKRIDEPTRKVTFEWTDYRNGARKAECEMEGGKFIRAFANHLVPKGFRRIRYYGILCGSKEKLRSISGAPAQSLGEKAAVTHPRTCECCGGTSWTFLVIRVKPFDVTPRGSEIKSFSLGWDKIHPPWSG
jgi:hypothetical protein